MKTVEALKEYNQKCAVNQKRLEYLHCLMKWMYVISEEFAKAGNFLEVHKRYPEIPSGFESSSNPQSAFPTSSYGDTIKKFKYSWETYPKVGMGGVDVGKPLEGGASGRNIPFVPGFAIDPEQFHGPEAGAIGTLTHEPQHDLSQGGLGGHETIFGGRHVSPVGTGFLEDNINDLMNWVRDVRFGSDATKTLLQHLRGLCSQSPPVQPKKNWNAPQRRRRPRGQQRSPWLIA